MTTDLVAFRSEIREFCAREMPPELHGKALHNQILEKEDYVSWQKLLRKHGWFGGHWPKKYGGAEWSKLRQWVFEDELGHYGAPWIIPFGVTYVGPVIYTFGTEEQKDKYLGPILDSEIWWAQGYSEPNAGSDLASLKTRAVRDGSHYVLNGQKTWTTMAQWADMAFVLARTTQDGPPQAGISFLLVDLSSPGVTVRPIECIDRCAHLNEIFFEDVRVPTENLVGQENQGWSCAKFLLSQERLLVAEVGKMRRLLASLLDLGARTGNTRTQSNQRLWRKKITELEIRITTLEAVCLDLLGTSDDGMEPGAEASILKIMGSELMQDIEELALDVLAYQGLSYQTEALVPGISEATIEGAAGTVRAYLHGRAYTIYGGSNEIQRNIIAKSVLGL